MLNEPAYGCIETNQNWRLGLTPTITASINFT